MRAFIVNLRDLCAEPADVDREIENFLATQLVKHRKHFLRFAEREHRNENATTARERILKRLREALLFALARPSCRRWSISARALHQQDVDLFLRKNRGLRNRLIIKVHIAGVKQGSAFRTKQNSGGTENVAGVEEFKRELGVVG